MVSTIEHPTYLTETAKFKDQSKTYIPQEWHHHTGFSVVFRYQELRTGILDI